MKNDLLIKICFCLLGLVISVGGYAFAQNVTIIQKQIDSIAQREEDTKRIVTDRSERIVRIETTLEQVKGDVQGVKTQIESSALKIDRLIVGVDAISREVRK